jgi:hypothetical protein
MLGTHSNVLSRLPLSGEPWGVPSSLIAIAAFDLPLSACLHPPQGKKSAEGHQFSDPFSQEQKQSILLSASDLTTVTGNCRTEPHPGLSNS